MMRTASKSWIPLVAIVMSFCVSHSTRAETTPPPSHGTPEAHDGGHGKGDPVAMLTAALDLTADQQTQVKAIFETTHAQAKAVSDDTTLSQDDRMAKMKELHEAAFAKVRALLTPDQQKKFDEMQQRPPHGQGMLDHGHGPMGDPVAKLTAALNLTADQQTQVKAIFETMHPQMEGIEDDTTLSQDARMAKMSELRDATHAKVRALLTPDQLPKFDELLKQHDWHHD